MAVETVEIQEGDTGSKAGGVRYGVLFEDEVREAGGPTRDQGRSGTKEKMGVAPGVDTQAENQHGKSHLPSEGSLRGRVPDHHHHRRTVRKRTVTAVTVAAGPRQGAATEGPRWGMVYTCRDGLLIAKSASWSHGVQCINPCSPDLEEMEPTKGRMEWKVLGTTVLSGVTDARVPGTNKAGSDPGDSCNRLGLHSSGDRRG